MTDIHAPGGIRTRNPSKRAATAPGLRPRGHWDRRLPAHRYNLLQEELLDFFRVQFHLTGLYPVMKCLVASYRRREFGEGKAAAGG